MLALNFWMIQICSNGGSGVVWAKCPGVSWASGSPLLMIKYCFTVILRYISVYLDQTFFICSENFKQALFMKIVHWSYEIVFVCRIHKCYVKLLAQFCKVNCSPFVHRWRKTLDEWPVHHKAHTCVLRIIFIEILFIWYSLRWSQFTFMWLNLPSPLALFTPHWGQVETKDQFFKESHILKAVYLISKVIIPRMHHTLKCMYIFKLDPLLSCAPFTHTGSKNWFNSPHAPLHMVTLKVFWEPMTRPNMSWNVIFKYTQELQWKGWFSPNN